MAKVVGHDEDEVRAAHGHLARRICWGAAIIAAACMAPTRVREWNDAPPALFTPP